MGITAALVFANLGAAYGTAKSGVGIVSVAVLKPELLFRSIIPVVMAGVLGMYGMIIAILLKGPSKYQQQTNFSRSYYIHPPTKTAVRHSHSINQAVQWQSLMTKIDRDDR
jgi:ATP synthase proteolipid subunit